MLCRTWGAVPRFDSCDSYLELLIYFAIGREAVLPWGWWFSGGGGFDCERLISGASGPRALLRRVWGSFLWADSGSSSVWGLCLTGVLEDVYSPDSRQGASLSVLAWSVRALEVPLISGGGA